MQFLGECFVNIVLTVKSMNNKPIIHLIFYVLLLPVYLSAQPVVLPAVCLSSTEEALMRQVNEYRRQKGLEDVPLSKSLTYVAQMHVWDLAEHNPHSRRCNLHSWSNKGTWSGCCYTEDHARAACMWNKPAELTNYKGKGYEIAYWTDEPVSGDTYAYKALKGWKQSPGHNMVIVNSGKWKKVKWNAMGVGVYKGYAVVWFGELEDDEDRVSLCAE